MALHYLSTLDLHPFDGTFSFTTSRLHANITRALPTYDKTDPKTWPYVTLATIERHGPYQGYLDLPTGVAYERQALERYEAMYSAEERAYSATMNGTFHERYPFNYDRFELPKESVGMSSVEYRSYMGDATAVQEEWEDATFTADDNDVPYPSPKTPSNKRRDTENHSNCANPKCTETRRELAKLRGTLFDKESQLLSSQSELQEYEATETLRRNTLSDAEFQLEKEKLRAEAAEKDCMLKIEGNIELLKRIQELEMRVAEVEDLEAYSAELEGVVAKLRGEGKVKGGSKKRAREELELNSDEEMEEAVRAGKRIVLGDSD
jgi:hypothetical protein